RSECGRGEGVGGEKRKEDERLRVEGDGSGKEYARPYWTLPHCAEQGEQNEKADNAIRLPPEGAIEQDHRREEIESGNGQGPANPLPTSRDHIRQHTSAQVRGDSNRFHKQRASRRE